MKKAKGRNSKKQGGKKRPGRAPARRKSPPHEHFGQGARHAFSLIEEVLFSGTPHGYGFVTPPEDVRDTIDGDIFIPAKKTMGALDGDLVRVEYKKARTYMRAPRAEGTVTAIVQKRSPDIVGTVKEITVQDRRGRLKSIMTFVPENARLPIQPRILYREDDRLLPTDGDKVLVRLLRRPTGAYDEGTCEIQKIFGKADSRDANYQAILETLEVPVDFSEEVLEEASRAASMPLSDEGRVRRRETILTIDGADAKDLDDAVSVSRTRDGHFRLGVHIADVSAYVLPKTALDRAATERGTSLYFADKVVPMLPPALSNGACSLNAGEDKYALSACLTIDEHGELTEVTLEKSIIRSSVRGVYSEVNDVLDKGSASPFYEKYKPVIRTLKTLERLYRILHERRVRLGGLELDRPEAKIILNAAGHPVDIVRRERGVAERIIEECMLMANEGVARVLSARERPCVYRVHGAPSDEHVREFVTFAARRGLPYTKITPPYTGNQFRPFLTAAAERGIGEPISYLLLRTMEKAKYSHIRAPHFGLGLTHYCHFTSPIRRLSDLATHRTISELLANEGEKSRLFSYAERAANAATETEVRALTAERQIEALYKTVYMADHIGEVFSAHISSVTSFGIFAELYNTCEGLIPLDALPYPADFDEEARAMTVAGKRYEIGDEVTVKIEAADIATARVRFALI